MPIIKSAKKRVRTAEKAAVLNAKTRKSVRRSIKMLQQALDNNDKKALSELFSQVQSSLDTAVKKNIIHKNKAARKKSQLAEKVKKAGGTIKKTSPSSTKPKKSTSTVKKTTTKTTTSKKSSKK